MVWLVLPTRCVRPAVQYLTTCCRWSCPAGASQLSSVCLSVCLSICVRTAHRITKPLSSLMDLVIWWTRDRWPMLSVNKWVNYLSKSTNTWPNTDSRVWSPNKVCFQIPLKLLWLFRWMTQIVYKWPKLCSRVFCQVFGIAMWLVIRQPAIRQSFARQIPTACLWQTINGAR